LDGEVINQPEGPYFTATTTTTTAELRLCLWSQQPTATRNSNLFCNKQHFYASTAFRILSKNDNKMSLGTNQTKHTRSNMPDPPPWSDSADDDNKKMKGMSLAILFNIKQT
jgi:hypothetical protein